MVKERRPRCWGGRWEEMEEIGRGGQGRAYSVRDNQTNSTGWVLKELHQRDSASSKRRGRFSER